MFLSRIFYIFVKIFMSKKEIFIEKAKKVHGDKYDYSNVKYYGSKVKVRIICHEKDENGEEHGEFLQTPQGHIRGNTCPKCANKKRGSIFKMTTEDFIKKAIETHGDKYDYSKVEYVNAQTKVCVICPIHGEFWMMPMNHIYQQKQGCPKCANRGLNTEEIIKKFREVHGNKYDYSKVEYVKMHNKVRIICPMHGEFEQTPSKHLLGQGCKKCGIIERAKKKTKTTEQFIKEAKAIHGDKYDYSKTEYVNAYTKVKIICPTHGEFEQRPFDHIHNHGCPMCSESLLEREIKTLLEEHNIEFESQKRFDWLDKQSLDFYIPKLNIAIECQGGQHFDPIEHFGGEREFKVIQERDKRKNRLCSENGIKILYYSNIEGHDCITDKNDLLNKIL